LAPDPSDPNELVVVQVRLPAAARAKARRLAAERQLSVSGFMAALVEELADDKTDAGRLSA
jgi:hypothetical protein